MVPDPSGDTTPIPIWLSVVGTGFEPLIETPSQLDARMTMVACPLSSSVVNFAGTSDLASGVLATGPQPANSEQLVNYALKPRPPACADFNPTANASKTAIKTMRFMGITSLCGWLAFVGRWAPETKGEWQSSAGASMAASWLQMNRPYIHPLQKWRQPADCDKKQSASASPLCFHSTLDNQ